MRKRRDRLAARHPADSQTESVDGEITLPDLWDIGIRYPGSPKTNRNSPVDILMVDVRGERVCVARKNKQQFRKPGTGPAVAWLWRPNSVPQLWRPPHHHALTHALRLLQVVSCTYEGHHRQPDTRMIRGEILPNRLLQECGAKSSFANELIALLCEHNLLHSQQVGGKEDWFVTTRIRGVGPHYELYSDLDIPEGILPEFLEAPQVVPTTTEGTIIVTEEATETTTEQPLLLRVYDQLVQRGHQATHELSEGWLKFSIPGELNDVLATALGTTPYHTTKVLDHLRKELKVYRTSSGGRGKPFIRYVKLDQEDVVMAAAESMSAGKKGERPQSATPQSAPQAEQPEGDHVSAEEYQRILTVLSDRLEQLSQLNGKLEEELRNESENHAVTKERLAAEQTAHAETKRELEAALLAQTTIVIPPQVAKWLDDPK